MPNEQAVTVYEYLRPENTMDKVDYYLPAELSSLAERLASRDIHPCCDIYPDGKCSVYLYSSPEEVAVLRLCGQQHSTADVAIRELYRLAATFDNQLEM